MESSHFTVSKNFVGGGGVQLCGLLKSSELAYRSRWGGGGEPRCCCRVFFLGGGANQDVAAEFMLGLNSGFWRVNCGKKY